MLKQFLIILNSMFFGTKIKDLELGKGDLKVETLNSIYYLRLNTTPESGGPFYTVYLASKNKLHKIQKTLDHALLYHLIEGQGMDLLSKKADNDEVTYTSVVLKITKY